VERFYARAIFLRCVYLVFTLKLSLIRGGKNTGDTAYMKQKLFSTHFYRIKSLVFPAQWGGVNFSKAGIVS
jgi:hypothetical protein